jgi:hypothetical protein
MRLGLSLMMVLFSTVATAACTGDVADPVVTEPGAEAPPGDPGATPPSSSPEEPGSDPDPDPDPITNPTPSPPLTLGSLAGIPSEEGPHVAELESLGDDSWYDLGVPEADPEHGVARGRSWGGRALMPAPDLRGAFYTGEGVHAFVKPDGHGMDDVWFYDINRNRWIAIYPGTHVASFSDRVLSGELRIDDDGQLVDGEGHHVPVHTLIHAWDFLSYDTTRGRFAWIAGSGLGRYYVPGGDALDPGLAMLEAQREERPARAMSPWYFETREGHFLREPAVNEPHDVGSFSAFVYIPSMDRFFNGGSGGVQLYDPEANSWTLVEDDGPRPPGYDHGVAYDPTRELIYMGSGEGGSGEMYVFDLASSSWTQTDSDPAAPSSFRTNEASVFYDSSNDVITVFHYQDERIYVYDPDTGAWSGQGFPEGVLTTYASYNAFYDGSLNAYFLYVAGDSMDEDAHMWAYRLRR